ncbi:unnamed protein product [Ambrosiozyma monospora]|uniref:Unnamed protein product n=1 Tax=Ambrosiozyma monospora TaxID=43982 RepID=A0ACB5U2G4_AMBMO|nr:unnamed protein product [Ambrosiozyma monospora]
MKGSKSSKKDASSTTTPVSHSPTKTSSSRNQFPFKLSKTSQQQLFPPINEPVKIEDCDDDIDLQKLPIDFEKLPAACVTVSTASNSASSIKKGSTSNSISSTSSASSVKSSDSKLTKNSSNDNDSVTSSKGKNASKKKGSGTQRC